MGKFKVKKIIIASAVALIIGFLFIALRGPHVSNLLKKLILPELSAATGRQVMAQKIYINLFPLFIGAKDLRVFDNGVELLNVPKVKGYVGIGGLLKKEIVLKRLAISSPDIKSSSGQIEDIIRKIKEYSEMERKSQVKVKVNAVALNNGKFALSLDDASFAGSGVSIDAVMDKLLTEQKSVFVMPRINFTIRNINSKIKNLPELKAGIRGSLAIKKDILDVRDLQIGISGSKIDVLGEYPIKGGPDESDGRFNMRLNLLTETLKNIFNLKQRGEGFVSAKGSLRLKAGDMLGSVADMELKGEFYIQTLMELLHVDEKIEGFLDLSGTISGPLKDIKGEARARLRKGNLFSVSVDELLCNVSYGSGIFVFREGKAALYNGHGEAEATLDLIKSDRYAVHVKFSDIDSPAALDLIGWKPEIPFGKVSGDMKTSGNSFNPSGSFEYESRAEGRDVLGRIRKIKGAFNLRNDMLTLSDVEAKTNKSVFVARGDLDLNISSIVSLDLHVKTTDVTDLTLPFRDDVLGAGEFAGKVTGKFSDPVIEGTLHLSNASLDGYPLGLTAGDVRYRKELLQIKNLSAFEKGHGFAGSVSGAVRFPRAAELFDFKHPDYGLSISLKNADLENAVKFVYRKRLEHYPKGVLHAEFTVNGAGPDPLYQGSMRASNVQVSRIKLDSAELSFSYSQKDFSVRNAIFRKGSSAVNAEGKLSHDDRFSLKVDKSRIYLSDIGISNKVPSDAFFSLKAEGSGSIEDPFVEMEGLFHGGNLNGSNLGDGSIKAVVKDRNLKFAASFFDDRATLSADANLKDDMPWKARLDVKSGRYDFLLTAFLKDVPEDLFVNMRGYADMSGNMNEFTADAVVNQVKTTLYGHSFTNENDIVFRVKNRKVYFNAVNMRSGGIAKFKVSGSMEVGREYDLVFEGSSSLSPVKGFYKRIEAIRGDSEFVFAVNGKWETPKVSGGLTVSNAFFGLKDIPHRITSTNGYLYVDEDKIVIQALSGKVGGGDININGVAYLKRFKMKNFFVDVVLNDISVNAAKDFPVNFNGNMLYKGTPESQTISGEVRINRAKYRDRFEWKSRIFKAKQVEKPKGEIGAFERAALNVRIYGSDNITIDNNIARASLRVEMLLRGTLFQPVLLGRIESKSGDVYFRNNEFRILNASADFTDPLKINPFMEIIAETSIKGYEIRLNLEGHTDQFLLTLVSDPPLDEIDILSLLTVGRLGKELKGIEGGIGAGEAASFLTGRVQDVLEERVRTLTGLDRLEVDPYVSKTTGNVTPRVTVSKRLIGEKLFVTYSSAVGSTENNLLKIEYIFNKNMSLVGVRDERGSIGSDIKFRFEFK